MHVGLPNWVSGSLPTIPWRQQQQQQQQQLRGDRDVVMAAVGQNGFALELATKKLRGDREVVMTAVAQDGFAVQYACDELRGDQEVTEAAFATASANGEAPVGLKAHLNPACLFFPACVETEAKVYQNLVHVLTVRTVRDFHKGKGEAFQFLCLGRL